MFTVTRDVRTTRDNAGSTARRRMRSSEAHHILLDHILHVFIRSMRRAVLPGPSRLTNDHVRALIPVEAAADLVRPGCAGALLWVNKVAACRAGR